jgi:NADP-dependent 3-hydroxy acid dehydrogenase YdfG
MKHKPLDQQCVVIIGASSGIGRQTALQFAKEGSKVLVAARSTHGIKTLVDEIKDIQKVENNVIGMICDVKDMNQIKSVADAAINSWGRIDTWVHTPSVFEIAKVEQTTEEEAQQIMDVNFMGVLRSTQVAIPHLRNTKGALIIVGSVEGRRSAIYQGLYASSKHAVTGLIMTLRMELYQEGSGISLTEIIPPTMDTPIYNKARVKLDGGKWVYAGPPIVYKPNVAADCILYAARYPCKELYVGLAASVLVKIQCLMPSVLDKAMIYFGTWMEKTAVPKGENDNLFAPMNADIVNKTTGSWNAFSLPFSLYNWVMLHTPSFWPFSYY